MATNRIPENHWLRTKPIAHRGYWGGDVPENSRAAYERAAEKGYPIEIDVYLTKDEKIVSFHDGTLKRMTGGEGGVWDYTYEELQQFRLGNSQETIPLLSEVLAIAEGRSPLLIEIKEQKNENIVARLLEALEGYAGEYAVQSFMPQYIHEVKRRAPAVIRGILASDSGASNPFKNFIMRNMSLNFWIRPDFVSYVYTGYPLPRRKVKNKVKLAWTVTSREIWQKISPFVDNIIFEHFDITE